MSGSVYLYGLIIGCEAAFWGLLLLALAARYLLRRATLSRWLLLSLPVTDLLLLLFTALDLRSGAPAAPAHGLATAYVGFTVAFGSVVVAWADGRFAHRFAGGPPPTQPPRLGWHAARYELALWLRCLGAWAITLVLLVALIAYVGDEERTRNLHVWFRIAFVSAILWFVFGPLWAVVFFRRAPATSSGQDSPRTRGLG